MVSAALVATAAALTFVPARRSTAARQGAPAKARVGLVFDIGGRGDKGFNDAAFEGISRAERELGVDVAFIEPAGSEDREAGLRLFAAQGYDLVIGVGFIFSSDVSAVAPAYPRVKFACIDYATWGGEPPSNVAGLTFREEEGSFLVGAAAGLMTRTREVAFVGGMTGPLIRKFEAGYEAGVREVCPTCRVRSAYIGSTPDAYRDPARGKAIAVSQIAAGADIVYHAAGASGLGVFEAASGAGARAIGVDSDQHDERPDTVITSMVKRADVAVVEVVRDVLEGRFRGGVRVMGLAEGGVDWIHEGPHAASIPEDVRARVEALRSEIVAGAIRVPSQ